MSAIVQSREEIAVAFLQLVVSGQIIEAYEKYVHMAGKHHNPYSPAGFPELEKAMIENHLQFPVKQYEVKNVLSEGNLVAVHGRIILRPGDAGIAVVHLFRFQDGKIIELWDIGQPVPADSPNRDGMF